MSLNTTQIPPLENRKVSGKEVLAIQLMEYFKRHEGIEIYVQDLVEYFKVDGKKIRRVLRELRARDRDLFYYKDGVRLVYVYKPTPEILEKVKKINELKNKKNNTKPLDTSDLDIQDIEQDIEIEVSQ